MSNGPAQSYTVWERLDPESRNEDLTATLRMALADPLWMLARQQQFGEFAGEDAGSPVQVDLNYAHDRASKVRFGPDTSASGDGASDTDTVIDYDAEASPPLETLIEREPVAAQSDEGPPLRVRIEAGMNFLDRLRRGMSDAGVTDESLPVPGDFRDQFWPEAPSFSDEAGRRFSQVFQSDTETGTTTARALDGHVVYHTLARVPNIGTSSQTRWGAVPSEDLPRPEASPSGPLNDRSSAPSGLYKGIAEAFVTWYRDLHDEPGAGENAWNGSRMEYEAALSTGAESDETVFEVAAYPGGRLDWYDFTSIDKTLSPKIDPAEQKTRRDLPTQMRFRGQPAARLWEMEDSDVNLSSLSAAENDLSRLFLLEHMLLSGDDWYSLPIDAPIGTVTRIESLEVEDSFGRRTTVDPTVEQASGDWSMYTFDLPSHGAPGLFLPPVLGGSLSTDPVERVRFARDEMANLMFGIEELVEGPLGLPIDRSRTSRPRLSVTDVHPASSAEDEYIEVTNEGDDRLDVSGWTVVVEGPSGTTELRTFGTRLLDADSTLRLYTGGASRHDTDETVHAGLGSTVLTDRASVKVFTTWKGDGNLDNDLLLQRPVRTIANPDLRAYRIASDVPEHWFPYSLEQTQQKGYQYQLALLLDASAQAASPDALLRPLGTILDPDVEIWEEEVTRSGTQVDRRYQLAGWLDGASHLWSGLERRPGTGEESSGLRFDFLTETS